jgi:hypothetical protein
MVGIFLGYSPACGTEMIQALLRPGISRPVPFLRREVIVLIPAIIRSVLQKNQFP